MGRSTALGLVAALAPARRSPFRTPIVPRFVALLALAITACAEAEHTLALELPPHEDASAIIVGLEARRTLELHALDATTRSLPIVFDTRGAGREARLWALYYHEPLEALGLEAGPLVEVEGGRTLPDEDRRLSTLVALDTLPTPVWADASERSPALASFEIAAAPTACPELEAELFGVDSPSHAPTLFFERLDDTRALLGLEDGQLLLVDATGQTTPVATPRDLEVRGLFVDGDELWVAGAGRVLARGRLEGTNLVVETSTRIAGNEAPRYLDVEHTPSGPEVRALARHGGLVVWTEAGSRVIHQFTPIAENRDGMGAIARVGPREWVAVHEFSQYVVRVRDGLLSIESLPPVGAPRKIIHSDTFGTVLGTTDGVFLRFDGRAWELITGSPLTVFASSLAASGPGFFYGGTYGNVGYYEPSTGYCPLTRPVNFHLENMTLVGRDLYVSGQNQDSARTPFAILRRR